MKHTLFLLLTICLMGCGNKSAPAQLTAADFSAGISGHPGCIVLDVRTPEEFSEGHLPDAVNFDWNGKTFDSDVATLDKSKPVYVYCRSGNRSAKAATWMRNGGFTEVYDLAGGILKWQAAGLPVSSKQ